MSEINPCESDAVLGGQNSPPINAAVLGGLLSVKQRLESTDIKNRFDALGDAINYGDRGINIAFNLLEDLDINIRQLARQIIDPVVRKQSNKELSKIINLFPWKLIIYDPNDGIKVPYINGYTVTMNSLKRADKSNHCDLSELDLLMQDSYIEQIQSLFLEIDYQNTNSSRILSKQFRIIVTTLNQYKALLANLKAFCIGKRYDTWDSTYESSRVGIFDFRYFLEIFPNLEALHIYGGYRVDAVWIDNFKIKSRHDNLKMLVIDEINDKAFYPLDGSLEMPNLEYLELGLDRLSYDPYPWNNYNYEPLLPILSGYVAPKLKYLILHNCNNTDELITEILNSPILENLTVLDLQMGSLSDISVEKILDCPSIRNLKFMNLSRNCFSDAAIEKLKILPFHIQTDSQYSPDNLREYQLMRYGVSNE